ncbi:MAG: FAD-dependent oxidoreductase [Pseudomonadota bacterium]
MALDSNEHVTLIGGGQAGAQVAFSLRGWGFDGPITLLCEEDAPPYQRPPLSKAFLKGELPEERLYLKPEQWYSDNRVEVVRSTRAEAIDRAARRVRLTGGASVDYDRLVIATGSRPRPLPLPGADLSNVFELRGLADVKSLAPVMEPGRHMVIIGAGYIGLEAAAVARQMGLEVTVLEMAPRVLARVTSPLMSEFYEREHTAKGVDIRLGAGLASLSGEAGAVNCARLGDGTEIAADIVLVGIGILPNTELAEEAGIACKDGILVDRDGKTNDPRVYAAGDCAHRPLVHFGRSGRLESVHNAIEQGKLIAASLLGRPRPPEDTPWFWSDQYDLKLQIAGLSEGYDEIAVRGDPGARRFAAFYLRQGQLLAVDAVNSAPEFLASKRLIAAGAKLAAETLTDTSVSMKEIAATAI